MIVSKFLHTRMRVNDLERTLKFYQQVFGLEVTRRHESPRGSKLAFLAVPNSEEEIEITYFPGSGPVEVQEDLMHLAFEVESMEVFQKHLDQIGVSLSDGPTQSSSGSIFAFVDAPEGYEIEVIERPK
jgi:lactoylglutathione lyase